MSKIIYSSAVINSYLLQGPWRLNCHSCKSHIEFNVSDKSTFAHYNCPACNASMDQRVVERDLWVHRS